MKLKDLLIIMSIVLSLSSCKKFLETTPLSNDSPETFYTTEQQLVAALAGVYDQLARSETYGDQMLGRMALDADEAYFGRTSTLTGVAVNNTFAGESYVANNWKFWYDGINRANYLLQYIDKPTMEASARAVIKGEALFLRAYYHFMLVKHWGDVPLMVKAIQSPEETNAPRTPAKEVYAQIVADMIEAETLVRTAKEVGHGGKVNKSAVRGVLARVYLHMAGQPINDVSKYKEARDWALKVMSPDPKDGFSHSLNSSFQDVFIRYCQDKYDINESIWEAEFQGNGTEGGFVETGRVGSNNGILYTGEDPNYGYSYAYVIATPRLWYLFDNPDKLLSSDERRDWSISPYKMAGTPAIETPFTVSQIIDRSSGKWRRELEVVSPKSKNAGPINFPLLRYSDVLLMFAEAENKVNGGPTPASIAAVNQVRRRAYGKDLAGESIRMVQVTNAGVNYTSSPSVVFSGGGGSGAVGKAFVSAGKIIRVKILEEGTGYTSTPTISFIDGGGSGGQAIALISSRRTSAYELDLISIGSEEAFQKAIEDERSRELCFETFRKGDLIRWGKYVQNMKLIESDFLFGNTPIPSAPNHAGVRYFRHVAQKDLLWPLSPSEMSLNR